MERWQAKLIVLVGILVIPFFCTILPCKVSGFVARKGERGKKMLSCLMCFGGGVFFATYILHMAPEARYILHHAVVEPYHINYPLADLLMGAGFFLVFYIEKLVIKTHKMKQQKKNLKRRQRCQQFNKYGQYPIQSATQTTLAVCVGECDCEDKGCRCQLAADDNDTTSSSLTAVVKPATDKSPTDTANATNPCPLLGTGECCNDPAEIQLQDTKNDMVKMFGSQEPQWQTEEQYEELEAHFTRSLVLLLALSLHRIFEGMSIGLQTSISAMAHLFVAVMCHETVIGFSLGLQFVKNEMSTKKIIVASFLCSTIMPIGVAIGTMIVEMGNQSATLDIVNGVLQSLATGTFIYVTFFEILQEEISPHDTSLSKVTAVLIGFTLMAVLSAVPEETNPTEDPSGTTISTFVNASFLTTPSAAITGSV